jgi:chemotaxis protein CheC
VVDPEVSVVAPAEVTRFVGVPDGPMVGIALGLTGPFVAHVVLLMEPANALSLVDLLMGQESGTAQEVDAMSESALGEVGNIMGSFFATVVADLTRLTLWSTTPVVHLDTARALIDALVAPPGRPIRQVLVISTRFEQHPVSGHGRVSGIFVVLPDAGGMDVLLNALRAEAG